MEVKTSNLIVVAELEFRQNLKKKIGEENDCLADRYLSRNRRITEKLIKLQHFAIIRVCQANIVSDFLRLKVYSYFPFPSGPFRYLLSPETQHLNKVFQGKLNWRCLEERNGRACP